MDQTAFKSFTNLVDDLVEASEEAGEMKVICEDVRALTGVYERRESAYKKVLERYEVMFKFGNKNDQLL